MSQRNDKLSKQPGNAKPETKHAKKPKKRRNRSNSAGNPTGTLSASPGVTPKQKTRSLAGREKEPGEFLISHKQPPAEVSGKEGLQNNPDPLPTRVPIRNIQDRKDRGRYEERKVRPADLTILTPTNVHHRNIVLGHIRQLRRGVDPIVGMLEVVVETVRHYRIPAVPTGRGVDKRNLHWTRLMTSAFERARTLNITCDPRIFVVPEGGTFLHVSSDARMAEILQDTFQNHVETAVSEGVNDPQKTANYNNMMQRYHQLQSKERSLTEFDEPMTKSEKAFMKRVESGGNKKRKPYKKRYQNENANCYLGVMIHLFDEFVKKAPQALNSDTNRLCDAFHSLCCYVHGKLHESVASAVEWFSANRTTTLLSVNLCEFWREIFDSPWFNTEASQERNIDNATLTIGRLLRVTTLVTGKDSLWGIAASFDRLLLDELVELWKLEKFLENKVKISHAICWYVALERHTMISPIHDRQDLSGEQIIGNAVGRQSRDIRIRPGATPFMLNGNQPVFPLRSDLAPPDSSGTESSDEEEDESDDGLEPHKSGGAKEIVDT